MLHIHFAEFTGQSRSNDLRDGFRKFTPDARGEIPEVHQVVHVVERPEESPELNPPPPEVSGASRMRRATSVMACSMLIGHVFDCRISIIPLGFARWLS